MAKLTFEKAIQIAHDKEGYEPCTRKDHGFGSTVTYEGKTDTCKFMICPILQMNYPKPSFLFHSKDDFIRSCEIGYKIRGYI